MPEAPAPDPARAAETKGRRTQRRILEAAIAHFAAVGYDRASVPVIANQVGVSHSTLYQHFGRKEDLFRASVQADLSALLSEVSPALESADPAPDRLAGLLSGLVALTADHPLARRVLLNLDGDQAEALRDLPALAALEQRLESVVVEGQAKGALRGDLGPRVTAEGLLTICLALVAIGIRLEGRDFPRARAAERFLREALAAPSRSHAPDHPAFPIT